MAACNSFLGRFLALTSSAAGVAAGAGWAAAGGAAGAG